MGPGPPEGRDRGDRSPSDTVPILIKFFISHLKNVGGIFVKKSKKRKKKRKITLKYFVILKNNNGVEPRRHV